MSRDPRVSNLDIIQVWSDDQDQPIYGYTDNFSRSGVFVCTQNPLPIGTKVRLVFTVVSGGAPPKGGETKLKSVDVHGEVVRVIKTGEKTEQSGPGMGIRFIDLDPEVQELIDDIVSQPLELSPSSI